MCVFIFLLFLTLLVGDRPQVLQEGTGGMHLITFSRETSYSYKVVDEPVHYYQSILFAVREGASTDRHERWTQKTKNLKSHYLERTRIKKCTIFPKAEGCLGVT